VDWRIVLIPLIPLAVWIIATIFRSLDESKDKKRTEQDDQPGGDGDSLRPRPQRNDLDQLVQEERQRRTVARAPRALPPRQEPPPLALPVQEETPVLKPAPVSPLASRSEGPPRPREQPRPASTQPAPVPVVRPVSQAPTSVPQPAPAAPFTPPVAQRLPAPPVSPVMARVFALLRERTSLQSAFLLREILDRPKCQRGRGIGPM
jgi:hypothetical protein